MEFDLANLETGLVWRPTVVERREDSMSVGVLLQGLSVSMDHGLCSYFSLMRNALH